MFSLVAKSLEFFSNLTERNCASLAGFKWLVSQIIFSKILDEECPIIYYAKIIYKSHFRPKNKQKSYPSPVRESQNIKICMGFRESKDPVPVSASLF